MFPGFNANVLLTHTAIAITTAGGIEIHAAMISQEKETCMFVNTNGIVDQPHRRKV